MKKTTIQVIDIRPDRTCKCGVQYNHLYGHYCEDKDDAVLASTGVRLEAKFCKRCNRWGGHDDSAAHGD